MEANVYDFGLVAIREVSGKIRISPVVCSNQNSVDGKEPHTKPHKLRGGLHGGSHKLRDLM